MNSTQFRTSGTDKKQDRTAIKRSKKTLVLLFVLCLVGAGINLLALSPAALADEDDCTGTPADPIYPGYNSAQILATYENQTAGTIPIRRGFYCVPAGSEGNPALESQNGFGFGLDKVQNRHNIGQQSIGWTQAEAIKAVQFVLSAPPANTTTKSDGFGFGWNYVVYAVGGTECPEGTYDVDLCTNPIQTEVRGASTEFQGANEPTGGMPIKTGTDDEEPLGLQTVYCNYGDPTRLRCDDWVTKALIEGYKNNVAPS